MAGRSPVQCRRLPARPARRGRARRPGRGPSGRGPDLRRADERVGARGRDPRAGAAPRRAGLLVHERRHPDARRHPRRVPGRVWSRSRCRRCSRPRARRDRWPTPGPALVLHARGHRRGRRARSARRPDLEHAVVAGARARCPRCRRRDRAYLGGRARRQRPADCAAGRHRRGLLGAVALHVGDDRHAQGRDAPARQHPARLRDVRQAGAGHPARTTRACRSPKLFFAYGIGNSVFFPLSVGATTVLEPRPADAGRRWRERLARGGPTLFFAVPTFFAALLVERGCRGRFGVRSGRVRGGGAARAALQRRFIDRFGVEIIDGIGSTEALHIFLSNRPGDVRPGHDGAAGPRLRGRTARLDGQPRPRRQPGSLFVRRRRSRRATGAASRREPAPSSSANGSAPATPTCSVPTATTPAWAAATT